MTAAKPTRTRQCGGKRSEPVRGHASPPCYLHDSDPVYQGYLDRAQIFSLLNAMLEGERAGAHGLREMSEEADSPDLCDCLADIARDEARFCAMLTRQLRRLDCEPSRQTGVFYDKLKARRSLGEQLDLLDRGQSSVVASLNHAIPRILDQDLRDDLIEMRDVHVQNIERCAPFLATG